MKKIFTTVALMAIAAVPAMAGGLLTNTNQSASYVRQMSQEAVIDISSLYANPAGNVFLAPGFHLSINDQIARQRRIINTQFPLFAGNQQNPNVNHEFEGKAFAPVIPSFDFSYNREKWSINAHFGVVGGGGSCEFGTGLGSFEALYAGNIYSNVAQGVAQQLATQAAQGYAQQAIPQYVAAGMTLEEAQAAVAGPAAEFGANYAKENLGATMGQVYGGYNLDAYMKGKTYQFGFQVGGNYKFSDHFAGYLGLRGVYSTANYNGYVQNVSYTLQGNTVPANADLTMDASQKAFGVTPIIGFDWKECDVLNFAVKYEAPTKMVYKNKTTMNPYAQGLVEAGNATLAQYADGAEVREDIPGIFTLGVQYSPIKQFRINMGVHEFFDKSAKKSGDRHKLIDRNTWEYNAGLEWDVCDRVTISASYQTTQYGLSDEAMSDLSFNLSNHMVGAGLRVKATEKINIDLGYMHTFYGDRTVNTTTAAGIKADTYSRKNDVVGVGINFAF